MLNPTRRGFFRLAAAVPALPLLSASRRPIGRDRLSRLVDTSKCIGCKRCMSACKRWNNLEMDRLETATDRETDLSGSNWIVVNLRADGINKADLVYVPWQCQHCHEPACAGVCPVTAITKLPEGPVVINENKCIGCRYCFQACPFKVPRFDFHKRVTRKCTLCFDRVTARHRLQPACVAACPVEALSFDSRNELIVQAQERVNELGAPWRLTGETIAGGTDNLMILPGEPENLGLPSPPDKVINDNRDKIRITSTGFVAASVMAGAMYLYSTAARRRERKKDDEAGD